MYDLYDIKIFKEKSHKITGKIPLLLQILGSNNYSSLPIAHSDFTSRVTKIQCREMLLVMYQVLGMWLFILLKRCL